MSQEAIRQVMNRETVHHKEEEKNSTGIGLDNVRNRLELYYNCGGIMSIHSQGENKGTEVVLMIPAREEKSDVSDFTGR